MKDASYETPSTYTVVRNKHKILVRNLMERSHLR